MGEAMSQSMFEQAGESARAMAGAGGFPPTYWIQITNIAPGTTFVVVPQAGNLWVFYEWGNAQAREIGVWHQGGSTTPVNAGENNVAVGYGDMLYYALGSPGSDTIKIGYQMT
jgi:hypothetical protein